MSAMKMLVLCVFICWYVCKSQNSFIKIYRMYIYVTVLMLLMALAIAMALITTQIRNTCHTVSAADWAVVSTYIHIYCYTFFHVITVTVI